MERVLFWVVNRFIFYNKISENVNNKRINCPRTVLIVLCLRYEFLDCYKILRMRELKSRFPHSENCSVPLKNGRSYQL